MYYFRVKDLDLNVGSYIDDFLIAGKHEMLTNSCVDPEGVGALKNHKNIGFLSNTGPDPLKNQKATKQAFNVGPTSARQRNAIGGPLIVVFGCFLPSSTKRKTLSNLDPLWQNFLDRRMQFQQQTTLFSMKELL